MTGAKRTRRASTRTPVPAKQPSALLRYRALLIGLAVVAGVLVIGFVLLQSASGKPYVCSSLLTPPPTQATEDGTVGFETTFLGQRHPATGTTITYAFCPPTSGDHYSSANRGPIRAGVYGPGAEQAPGGWVHNLEHGSSVLLYRCTSGVPGQGDCPSTTEMAALQQWFNDAPTAEPCGREAVVARFDAMSTRFAVVAWNRALLLDTFDNGSLALAEAFAEQWTNVTAPEPGNC